MQEFKAALHAFGVNPTHSEIDYLYKRFDVHRMLPCRQSTEKTFSINNIRICTRMRVRSYSIAIRLHELVSVQFFGKTLSLQ